MIEHDTVCLNLKFITSQCLSVGAHRARRPRTARYLHLYTKVTWVW